jgi:lysozyme
MKHTTSINGVKMIAGFEATILHLYYDVAGIQTVCTGHVTQPGEDWSTVTAEKCQATLGRDLSRFENAVNEYVSVADSQPMFDAMVSLAFNIGTEAFRTSSVVRFLNQNLYTLAADAFMLFQYAKVKQKDGSFEKKPVLLGRRSAEAALFRSGILEVSMGWAPNDPKPIEELVSRAQESITRLLDVRGLIDDQGLEILDTFEYAADGRLIAMPPEVEEELAA